jgi:hypothetical protein
MEERIYIEGSKIILSPKDQIKFNALDKMLGKLKLLLIVLYVLMISVSTH